jgi:hypothetical protein
MVRHRLGVLDKVVRFSKFVIGSCFDSRIENVGATLPGTRHGLVEDSKTVAPDRRIASCLIDRGLSNEAVYLTCSRWRFKVFACESEARACSRASYLSRSAVRWQRFTRTHRGYVSFAIVSDSHLLKCPMALSIAMRARNSTETTIPSRFLAV